MNERPPETDDGSDLDERYRRESALDRTGPSEAVRRAVLEHAARMAEQRSAGQSAGQDSGRTGEPSDAPGGGAAPLGRGAHARNVQRGRRWRRGAITGTLAAAAIAGLMVAPRFLTAPRTPVQSAVNGAPAPAATPQLANDAATNPRAGYATDPEPAAPRIPAPAAKQQEVQMARVQPPMQNLAQAAGEKPATEKPAAAPVPDFARERAPQLAANAPSAFVGNSSASRAALAERADGGVAADAATMGSVSSAAVPGRSAKAGDASDVLRRAAQAGDIGSLQSALAGSPPLDARDAEGRTALMLATLSGQAQAVDVLLAHGADPNAADARGITPLRAALDGHWQTIAVALERAGAR